MLGAVSLADSGFCETGALALRRRFRFRAGSDRWAVRTSKRRGQREDRRHGHGGSQRLSGEYGKAAKHALLGLPRVFLNSVGPRTANDERAELFTCERLPELVEFVGRIDQHPRRRPGLAGTEPVVGVG
jgi:hypothetical protein